LRCGDVEVWRLVTAIAMWRHGSMEIRRRAVGVVDVRLWSSGGALRTWGRRGMEVRSRSLLYR